MSIGSLFFGKSFFGNVLFGVSVLMLEYYYEVFDEVKILIMEFLMK